MECQHKSKTWNKHLREGSVCVFVFEDKKEMENSQRGQRQPEKGSVITLALFPGWLFVLFDNIYPHYSAPCVPSV